MNVLTRVRELLGAAAEPEQPRGSATRTTALYRCEPCDATYVSEGLDCCGQCDNPVERVPTEHDIGLV